MPSPSLSSHRIAILGLGLMGGSLALALRGRCRALLGIDRDPATLALARRKRIVDFVTDDLAAALPRTDLLILAAPVRVNLAVLAELPRLHPGPLMLLDLSSTKGEIVAAMNRLPERFAALGGHPMCGKETSGLAHAEAALYRGARFLLTETRRTTPELRALAETLVAAIGARPLWLNAEVHDRLVALVSHLPYLAAVALVRVGLTASDPRLWEVAASGFRDTTRLAAGDLAMSLDILLTNRTAILDALRRYRLELETLTSLLERGDEDALRLALTPARVQRLSMFQS